MIIKTIFKKIYSAYVKRIIGEVGIGTTFNYPIKIEGGGQKNICIGKRCQFGAHSVLGCWRQYRNSNYNPTISIGNDCNIGEYTQISALKSIEIGCGLLTGRFVYIGDNSHGSLSWEDSILPPANRNLISKGGIKIGDNVWIGDKVTVLGGVSIGNNVIIGANSVVTHDIQSNCIACGIPAKEVRTLGNYKL